MPLYWLEINNSIGYSLLSATLKLTNSHPTHLPVKLDLYIQLLYLAVLLFDHQNGLLAGAKLIETGRVLCDYKTLAFSRTLAMACLLFSNNKPDILMR